MTVQEDDIATLTALGLTRTQAKVYLTCVSLGTAKAALIWKYSEVSRQDIYRVLTELQKIGLVEKILAEPIEFKAVEIQRGMALLLKRKAEEYNQVRKKANEILKRVQKSRKAPVKEYQFIITEHQEISLGRVKELLKRINKSVDVIE